MLDLSPSLGNQTEGWNQHQFPPLTIFQVEGLTSLTMALYSIVKAQHQQHEQEEVVVEMGLDLLRPARLLPKLLPASVASEVLQAAVFLEWMVAEISGLPPDERGKALVLPLDLINRVRNWSALLASVGPPTQVPSHPSSICYQARYFAMPCHGYARERSIHGIWH